MIVVARCKQAVVTEQRQMCANREKQRARSMEDSVLMEM